MNNKKGKLWPYLVALALIIFAGVMLVYRDAFNDYVSVLATWQPVTTSKNADSDDVNTEEELSQEEPEEVDLPNPTATFLAVGDVMMHDGQIWSGYSDAADSFDYTEFFHVVKDEISAADIAMANLETTLAGKEQKYTGYPMFNSPDEIADALKDAGFDIIVTSNNHSLDLSLIHISEPTRPY